MMFSEEQEVRVNFFLTLFRLIQSTKLHQANNELIIKLGNDFIKYANKFSGDDSAIALQLTAGKFYLQKEKLSYKRDMAAVVARAMGFFEEIELHGIEIYIPLAADERDNLFKITRLFNRAPDYPDPALWLQEQLEIHKIDWLKILPKPLAHELIAGGTDVNSADNSEEENHKKRCKAAKQSYAYVMSSLKNVAGKVISDKPVGVRQSVRVVQGMIDQISDDKNILLGLSTLRDFDDYTYTHSINVSILAMSLGVEIGLSRESLEQLGICGLFHDLGKIVIPHEILNKPGKLTDQEFEVIRKHTIYSVCQILKLKVSEDIRGKIMLPPFEHHMGYDLTGYPQVENKKPLSLLSKILTIADVYDAITSARVYRPRAMSPDRALVWMSQRAGQDFDPVLIKVFIKMMGVFPVGTLVKLDSDELAVVKSNQGRRQADRPEVVLLLLGDDGCYNSSDTLDLNIRGATGEYVRSIAQGVSPVEYGIQPAKFLM